MKDGPHSARGKQHQRQAGRSLGARRAGGSNAQIRASRTICRGHHIQHLSLPYAALHPPRTRTPRVRIRAAGQSLLSWVPANNPPPKLQPLPPPHLLRVPQAAPRRSGDCWAGAVLTSALLSLPVELLTELGRRQGKSQPGSAKGLSKQPSASLTHPSSRLC